MTTINDLHHLTVPQQLASAGVLELAFVLLVDIRPYKLQAVGFVVLRFGVTKC